MLTVQGFGRVPELVAGLTRDLRVLWALDELGLPYEFEGLDFKHLATPEHLARSPFAQLPTIEDDGLTLSESGEILCYLAEKAGMAGDIRKRAELNRWCFAALSSLEPAVLVVNLMEFQNSDAGGMKPQLVKFVERGLGGFDKRLATRDYVVDEFSIADILLTTVLRQLDGLGIVDKFPHVVAHKQRCEARPAFQRTLDAQEDRLGVPRGAARRSIPERRAMPKPS